MSKLGLSEDEIYEACQDGDHREVADRVLRLQRQRIVEALREEAAEWEKPADGTPQNRSHAPVLRNFADRLESSDG